MSVQQEAKAGADYKGLAEMTRQEQRDNWPLRFWAKVDKTGDCWLWTARLNRKGYGEFRFVDGSTQLAHRVSWMLAYGAFSQRCVLHKCDVRRCVRPDHFFEGTKGDNNRDMYAKGRGFRGQHGPSGERNGQAKLTRNDVVAIRNSSLSSRKIAPLYGICFQAVIAIRAGKIWRELNA
jgi:hypothetical protein